MNKFLQCMVGLIAASMVLFAPMSIARDDIQRITTIEVEELPREGRDTLALIKKGGPFPYQKDGVTFGNFERRLPTHERGYYKEYTVKTPGSKDRGARRIVAGKKGEYYYSADHYNTFKRVKE
jgi:ribonuclease T1